MRFAIILTVVMTCAFGINGYASETRVSGAGFDGVILDLPSTQKNIEVWIPVYDQISEMEKALPEYVKTYIKANKITLTKPITKYKRQYVGIKDNGRKLIGTNYYYDNLDFVTSKKWLKTVGDCSAGGDEYLGSVYDVDQKAFVLFEIYSKKADR